ncbi:MAG TPA: AraC family transcriptional regulator [Hyphomicrobiales bacterium]|nr:AraC family transcriptional regulator [Hyphomicrobiales bacterium]
MLTKRPDRLSALIQRFRVEAKMQTMAVRDVPDDSGPRRAPNLFVVGRDRLQILRDGLPSFDCEGPMVVFFPRGAPPDLEIRSDDPASDYVCASVDTGGDANPIALALPDAVAVTLNEAHSLQAVTDLLLDEALSPRCGGSAVIDRLCEILVIRLLRHLIEGDEAKVGLIAGLAHPNLSLAIVAIHDRPNKTWRLEDLAGLAAMSRTHFANTFRDVVGVTPGEYLSNWRLTLARMEIAKGTSVKVAAKKVGFASAASLSRAFSRRFGRSPRNEFARLYQSKSA